MVSLKRPTNKPEHDTDVAPAKSANVQMNITMPPALRTAIRIHALQQGMPANELVARVMSNYLEQQAK